MLVANPFCVRCASLGSVGLCLEDQLCPRPGHPGGVEPAPLSSGPSCLLAASYSRQASGFPKGMGMASLPHSDTALPGGTSVHIILPATHSKTITLHCPQEPLPTLEHLDSRRNPPYPNRDLVPSDAMATNHS